MGETTSMAAHLFFDVETTGLPRNYKAHYSQTSNWPRIVQLSWIVADLKGKILKESDNIIKVDFQIPPEVSRIHGITNDISQKEGVAMTAVLKNFLLDLENANCIICHNVGFDLPILQCELLRSGLQHEISKKTFCTMKNSAHYCQLPGPYGYKWPQLEELYRICFRDKIEGAHNAMMDVRATHKIFYHLVQEKIFSVS